MANDCGVATIRVATHCTEADVSEQHIALSRKLGLDTVGFLMMAHMIEPAQLLAQAKLMESYGANCIYFTDSAGYMLPDDVTARIGLLREKLSPATEIGFHGHHNLALGHRQLAGRDRGRRRAASTARRRASAPAPATRRSRCSTRCSTAWAWTPASTSSS